MLTSLFELFFLKTNIYSMHLTLTLIFAFATSHRFRNIVLYFFSFFLFWDIFSFAIWFFFFFFKRERPHACESVDRGGGWWEGENLEQALCLAQSLTPGLISWPRDFDLSWNEESDFLPTEPPRWPKPFDFFFGYCW